MLQKFPFRVEVIQTHNGAEFQQAFHWHVLDHGISHVYIKPNTPRLNGKVERSHRIDGEEFYRMLDGVAIDDAKVFNQKLKEWEDFYNYHRPHGALGGQTPYERLKQRRRPRVSEERQLYIDSVEVSGRRWNRFRELPLFALVRACTPGPARADPTRGA